MKGKRLPFRKAIKTWGFWLALMVFPFMCFALTTLYAYNEIAKYDLKNTNEAILSNISNYNDNIIKNIYSQADWLAYDLNTVAFIAGGECDVKRLVSSLQNFKAGIQGVESVYLYSRRADRIITTLGENAAFPEFRDTRWYYENTAKLSAQLRYVNKRIIENEGVQIPAVSIYQNIIINNEPTGIIVINIASHSLKGALLSDKYKNLDLFIFNEENGLIFSSDGEPSFLIPPNGDLDSIQTNVERNHSIVSQVKSAKTGFRYAVLTYNPVYSDQTRTFRAILSAVTIVLLIWIIVLALYVTFKLLYPVTNIVNSIEEYIKNSDVSRLERKSEMSVIANAITEIISNNKNYQSEIILYLNNLKKAQVSALQYQISPHFINNILATIRYMAFSFTDGENEVTTAISYLGSNLQVALSPNNLTTVQHEVENLERYIKLQKLRYGERFDAAIDVSPEVSNALTVKLILQPIVENAISHGFMGLTRQGHIHISCKEVNCVLQFQVRDDGIGMSAEAITALELDSDVLSDTAEHFGIRNVNQRLRILFGNEYGVKITSGNAGTTVTLTSPIMRMNL
ncbi:histidine kinase [Clostridia bacterium]|nr:histidine kinase [Clostridia bacterium]